MPLVSAPFISGDSPRISFDVLDLDSRVLAGAFVTFPRTYGAGYTRLYKSPLLVAEDTMRREVPPTTPGVLDSDDLGGYGHKSFPSPQSPVKSG
jgi:hypothetical protein